jgi:osmotically-inducible protein OsmY
MKTNLFLFSIFILILACPSFAMMPQKDQLTDQMMKTFVEYRLVKSELLVNDNIDVTVADGVITLDGTVLTLRDKRQAEIEVRKVDEDYRIINNLTIVKSNLSDPDLAKKVTEQLRKNVFYSIFDWVTVSANNGVVTLKGWAYLGYRQPGGDVQFVQEVERMPGVLGVKNEIQLTSGDEDLRNTAARLIYSDMRFESYAHYPDPPIHIIVIDRKVILEGKV